MITRSLTYEGIQCFDESVDPALLPGHLADWLNKANPTNLVVEGSRVFFEAGIFRMVNNWNVLVPFGFGELVIDPATRSVRYRLSFRQLVILGSVIAGFMVTFMLAGRIWEPVLFMPVMWVWLVGGNLMIGVFRFQRFIGRALENAPRKAFTEKIRPHFT